MKSSLIPAISVYGKITQVTAKPPGTQNKWKASEKLSHLTRG